MAAPPNAPYATHKTDANNGPSQQKAQATYPVTGHCPRCVRICIKCQRGQPQANGYPVPNLTQVTIQQQQQRHTCQSSCLSPVYQNSGHVQNAFHASVCIPVDNISDQSSQGGEQQAIERTPSDESQIMLIDDGQGCEYTKTDTMFSRPPLHGMSMQEKITEEATVDETTEKTSFMPSQRDSGPSTWQDASRVGQQRGIEDAARDTLFNADEPSNECSEKEFRSAAIQASLYQEELCEPLSPEPDKLGNPSEGTESEDPYEDCKEGLDRYTFANECTTPERHPLNLRESPSCHPRKKQTERVSSQRVIDCLQRCSEKLGEIQHFPDCNLQINDLDEYLMEQQQSPLKSEKICERQSGPVDALPINCTQIDLESMHLPSQGSFEKNLYDCTRQCNLEADIASRSPSKPPTDNLVQGILVSQQPTSRSSAPQSECITKKSTFSKENTRTIESLSNQHCGQQTTKTGLKTKTESPLTQQSGTYQYGSDPQSENYEKESSLTTQQACKMQSFSDHHTRQKYLASHSEDSVKKSLSKEQINQMKSYSKTQSGTCEQLPSESSGDKSSFSKDAVSTTVIHQPALGIIRHPSDSTVIKCTLTRENLSMCKQLCDKLKQMHSDERPHQRIQSKPPENIGSSQSTNTSRQQLQTRKELESPRMTESKRKAACYESAFKKSASQQDAILKRLSSRQESLTKKSVFRPEMTPRKLVAKKSVPRHESFSKTSASVHTMELSERMQLSEKPSVSKSVQSKGQNTQSSTYFVPIGMENKQLKPDTPPRNSDASQSFHQKQGSESTQSQRSRSMANSSLPADQTSSITGTKTSSGLAPQQVKKTPYKEKTPPQSQLKADSESTQSRSKSVSLKTKDELSKDTAAQTNSENAKTPPKSKTAKSSERAPDKNEVERSSTEAHTVLNDNDTPQPYCLQAYYLPLYQCAYCQQITPYPVSCQYGFASCPSPCDPCQYQSCQSSPTHCIICPYPMYAPLCPPPNPQDNQFEPVAQCSQTQTDQKDCPRPCKIESHLSSETCHTNVESNDCPAPCQPYDVQCKAPCHICCEQCEVPRPPCDRLCKVSEADDRDSDSKNTRRSLESDQLDLQSSDDKSGTIDDPLEGKFKDRSTAISDNSGNGSVERNKKSQRLRREIKGRTKKIVKGVGRAIHGRRQSRNEQEQYEKRRRETTIRKGTDKRDSMNTSLDKRKFRRIHSDDTSEEPIMKSQRSPHRSDSAYSRYRYTTTTRSITSNEGQAERQNDIKIIRTTDREDCRKSSRIINQNFFEKKYFRSPGLYRMVRTAQYHASPPLQSSVPRTSLRKQLPSFQKGTNRGDKITIDSHCPLPRECSIDTNAESSQLASSIFAHCWCQNTARCEQHTCFNAKFNNRTSMKNRTETKGGQIKNSSSNLHMSSSVDADSLSGSNKCDCLDRNNLCCAYYLPSTGAPHRANHRAVKKHLDKKAQDMDRSLNSAEEKPLNRQQNNRNVSSPNSSSASSHVRDLASRHPDCGLLIGSHCSCEEWMQDSTLPDPYNCCAHTWTHVLPHVCPLHSRLRCPRDSCRIPGRRRHTKVKPLSLHTQRTRLVMMKGKRLRATQTALK